MDELEIFLDTLENKFDMLCVTETSLMENDYKPSLNDYYSEHLTRKNKRGGGVGIYLKGPLKYSVVEELSLICDDVDCLTLKLEKVIASAIYRPTNGNKKNFVTFLETLVASVGTYNCAGIIMGDINMDWYSNEARSMELKNTLSSYSWRNYIEQATRFSSGTASSVDVCPFKP